MSLLHIMPVRTRRSTRSTAAREMSDLTRKIDNLSNRKKRTIGRTLTKLKTKLATKKERARKEAALKKKYGKFYGTYKQLEPRLTAHLANQIITIAKDYDKEQNKHKRTLKKLEAKRPTLQKTFRKLEREREQLEYDLNMASPTWRRLNLSPHVLRNLTDTRVNELVGKTQRSLGVNGNKQRQVMDRLMDLNEEIRDVEGKIDK